MAEELVLAHEVIDRAIVRFQELMPSFRDPYHYANHADIKLVQDLVKLNEVIKEVTISGYIDG